MVTRWDRPSTFRPRVSPTSNGHDERKPVQRPANGDAMSVEHRLLTIVRDRTGYPLEMLKLDLDLEADLGIDSIKRVEILGSLRDSLPAARNGSESELMDQLSRARTLGSIVERVNRHLEPEPRRNGRVASSSNGSSGVSQVRRRVVEAVDEPIAVDASDSTLPAGGLVLVTDDQRGIAAAVVACLQAKGFRAIRVVHDRGVEVVDGLDPWRIDFARADAIGRLVGRLRSEGQLVGIVHALPMRQAADAGFDAKVWDERLTTEVRGLFLLVRECVEDLATAVKAGGASLVAATGMGGGLASLAETPDRFFPGHGAIAGLVKTLAREWEGVRSRVIDFDPDDAPELIGRRLASELLAIDRHAEVGYRQGKRIALRSKELELPRSGVKRLEIRPGEPIVITGGGRGITAAVAAELAARWRPTLLLAGTSPMPPDREPSDVAGLTAPEEIKARLLTRLQRERREVGPAELERVFQSLGKEPRDPSNPPDVA